MKKLGHLEQVDLRTVWPSESGDFTPWLGHEANIQILSDTIGIELEVDGLENNVGPYRADILWEKKQTSYLTIHNEDFDPEATETWEEQFAWLQETLEAFREHVAPRVKAFLM
ncbi:MAG: hypothetical protein ACPGSB_01450 [Opitutales bacterium]